MDTGTSDISIVAALTEAARTINVPRGMQERLTAIVQAAPGTVPGFDHVSVTVAHRDGRVETSASSSELVEKLDLHQYEAGEGPCVDALHQPGVILVPSAHTEQRWPRYMPRAVQSGVTAQMAVHLHDDAGVSGSLNLYRTSGEGIDPEASDVAALFAAHAALALGRVRTEEQMTRALATRKIIGQAIGLLMERYKIDEERAFGFLTRASQNSNFKLRDIAREIVERSEARYH